MGVVLSSDQRSALREVVLVDLSGIDSIFLAIQERDWHKAVELRARYEADALLLDDLGWADDPPDSVELSMPTDMLLATLGRLHADQLAMIEECREDQLADLAEDERRGAVLAVVIEAVAG